ncbi:MAG: reprolysin-like metallopeptidase [Desulfobulbaceae bacterium]
MNTTTLLRRSYHLLRALPLLLILVLPGFAQETGNRLFTTTEFADAASAVPTEPHIKRSRPVRLNMDTLKAIKPAGVPVSGEDGITPAKELPAASAPVQPLLLNLFPDVELPVTIQSIHGNSSGSMTWTGKVDGEEKSLVLLIVRDGIMTGNISVGTKQYQVRPAGNNLHVVHEIDPAGYPSERDPDPVAYPPSDSSSDTPSSATDDTVSLDAAILDGRETRRVIDVMVAYTAAARSAQGGTTAMLNLIDLAVAETNTGYTNSGINQELNLVHTVEVSYTESGDIQLDRDRLKNPSDGYMDNVHTLRDTYSADLVPLIVANGGSYCGIAFIMDPVSTQFEDSAFCVVADECATGYYSFGHELGHIMAARHDWYVDWTDISPFTYNHGLTNPTDQWRTVMAYNNACEDAGTSCTRLLYWSNPDKTYGGDPMGVREGSFQAADNRKTLANTGFVVANFRVKNTSTTPSEEFSSGAVPTISIASGGPMFDVRAKKATIIHGFSVVFQAATVVPRIEIYYRPGTYVGFDADPSSWILAGSANNVTVNANPSATYLPIDIDIRIPAGETYAFYINTLDGPAPATNISYLAGTSEGALYAEDDSLELMEGQGVRYPFSTVFAPRVFCGTIYHSFAKNPSALPTVFPPNNSQDGIMFDIKARKTVTVRGFSTYMDQGVSGKMEIWYRKGTHVGHESTPADWTLVNEVNNVVGTNDYISSPSFVENRIPMEIEVTIPAGKIYGFYLTAAGNPNIEYRSGTSLGAVAAADTYLEVLEGKGIAYPFGANYAPRVFAGTVYYSSLAFPWPMFLPAIINSGN